MRWMGGLLLLPALLNKPYDIPTGEIRLQVMDVSQGLAILISTRHHNLIYDTGNRYSDNFDMASAVIIPLLRVNGISRVDTLVLSHGDADHAAAAGILMDKIPIANIISGEPVRIRINQPSTFKNRPVKKCESHQHWYWDGVKFSFLSPLPGSRYMKANNRSCVLMITSAYGKKILLTGDIEKKVERQLLKNYEGKKAALLKSDILLVPHHGSNTSSSGAFLNIVQPKLAIFSYGYKNRFNFPHPDVVQRYKSLNTKLLNTANGSIDIQTDLTNNLRLLKQYRYKSLRFWQRKPQELE